MNITSRMEEGGTGIKKRNRSINWSEPEKRVLKRLVMERADIIENKDTSTKTNVAKKMAWKEVLIRFNRMNGRKRDIEQLHNQWRNMKNKAKNKAQKKESDMNGERDKNAYTITVDADICEMDPIYIQKHERPDSADESQSPDLRAESPMWESPKILGVADEAKKIHNKFECRAENHEHELYLLEKISKEKAIAREIESHETKMMYEKRLHENQIKYERESHETKMMYERELYEKRIAVISLEEEYWKLKVKELKKEENEEE